MNINDVKGIHIELTNMCTLQCPGCARTRFLNEFPKYWKNYNLQIQDLFNFMDLDLSGQIINFCGNYGDPLYYPHLIEIVKEFKKNNAIVSIITNGSYKKTEWWEELCNLLDEKDRITFSIDGVPDNFTTYRINGDWESIERGIRVVSQAKCQSAWKYIVFSYNEKSIGDAKRLSEQLGLKHFNLEYSDRFDDKTEIFLPGNQEALGNRFEKQQIFKTEQSIIEVSPKCKKYYYDHFITADGYYTPCCFIADHRFYYKTEFGKNREEYNIRNNTLSQILEKPAVKQFYENLQNMPVCQYNCPKI